MKVEIISPGRLGDVSNKVVVVLDIFRASNTIMAFLEAGASRVYLLKEVDDAWRLHEQKPQALIFGERQGMPIPGMLGGNSPLQAINFSLRSQEVILTTSAGTQALESLSGAHLVLYGSFANAMALCSLLADLNRPTAFLPMGLQAQTPALEDDLAAEYLSRLLEGKVPDFTALLPKLLSSPGAERLRGLKQRDDLAFCTSLDILKTVPIVTYEENTPAAIAYNKRG